jgi:fatty-acid desaturase
MVGDRKYNVPQSPKCEARNVWWLTFVLLGDNWHNNHHAYATSARAGFEWYEIDCNYYFIYLCYCVGLVKSIRQPNKKVLTLYKEGKNEDKETESESCEAGSDN